MATTRFKGITYQGRYANFHNYKSGSQWVANVFRAPGSGKREPFSYSRPPVRGGRWKIRRMPEGPEGRPWRAWSDGVAKKWSRRFATQEEAIAWAHLVANTYRQFDNSTASATLGLVLKYKRHESETPEEADHEFLTNSK